MCESAPLVRQLREDVAQSSTRGTAASVLAAVCGDANWESIVPSLNAEKTLHVLLNSYLLDVRSLSERFDFYEKGLVSISPHAFSLELDD